MSGQAVILAGGLGTRLRPLTTLIPKPLVPIGQKHSIIDVAIEQLAFHGYSHIRIAVGHMSHLIEATIGDGSRWGVEITYIEEQAPLGTAGPLLMATDLPESFLVMNGDVLCDINYREMHRAHDASSSLLTVAATTRTSEQNYGVLRIDKTQIVGFEEKPRTKFSVSTGVYVVGREALSDFTPGTSMGFDSLILNLIEKGRFPNVYEHSGMWFDVGRPDDYDEVNRDAEALLAHLLSRA